jgi:hypothetical protein
MSDRIAVKVDSEVLAYLDEHAGRLGCSRHRLTVAILRHVAEDDMVDAILDGESPVASRPVRSHRKGRPRGGPVQDAVLAAIADHIDEDGTATIAMNKIAELAHCDAASVSGAVRGLIRDGRLQRIAEPSRVTRTPSVYRIPPEVRP